MKARYFLSADLCLAGISVSTSAISNIIAGIVITYMRPFQLGDRVKINGIVGDVVEKTILITHLNTAKNEDVTIPNANILLGTITNYSKNKEYLQKRISNAKHYWFCSGRT